jgi:hypothetical protein
MQQRLQWFYEHTNKAAAQHNISTQRGAAHRLKQQGGFAFPAG